MTTDGRRQYVSSRVTQTFNVGHLRAHHGSFAFLVHEKPVKLTTKVTKDTKNLRSVSLRCYSGALSTSNHLVLATVIDRRYRWMQA